MIDQETLKTFEKLYNDSYDNVLKYVICSCSNAEDVKDIVQSIYLELLNVLNKDNNFNKGDAYIMGIAKNKVNQYYRFKYKSKLVSLFSPKDDLLLLDNLPNDINLPKELIKKENLKYIWNFLKRKKVIVFKIFYLYYYTDMNIKDIAKELNISESNVKHYLYRTLNELKDIMNGRGDENV